MIERILIPLDGSSIAENVIPQVGRLLKRSDSEVLLVRAVEPVDMAFPSLVLNSLVSEAKAYVRRTTEKLRSEGVRVRPFVRVGPPAGVILDIAEEEHASLIAMSTHGRSGISRWVFGSIAEKVLRASSIPVLTMRSIVRGPFNEAKPLGPAEQPIRKILVPTDESARSLEAVPYAGELAGLFGAEVTLVHVRTEISRVAESPVAAAIRDLRSLGIETRYVELHGEPAFQILLLAEQGEFDLVVMATHGRSGPSRWIMGSVAEKLLRELTVPMLIVRGSLYTAWPEYQAEEARNAT